MNLWLRIKVWMKVTLFSILLVYILIFVVQNSGKTIDFWYWFGSTLHSSLLLFTLITFVAGAVVALLIRTIFKTIKQMREVEILAAERELADLKAKASMLQTRPVAPEQTAANDQQV
jgi:uncharacterized integral membrane protein